MEKYRKISIYILLAFFLLYCMAEKGRADFKEPLKTEELVLLCGLAKNESAAYALSAENEVGTYGDVLKETADFTAEAMPFAPVSLKSSDSSIQDYEKRVSNEKSPEDYIEEFNKLLPDGSGIPEDKDELLSELGFDKLLYELISAVNSSSGEVLSFFLLLLGTVLASSVTELSTELFGTAFGNGARFGISSVSALLIFSRIFPLAEGVSQNLSSVSSFFSSLIPIITGITASGGALGSAGVQAVNMNITLSLIGEITAQLLLPLVFAMFAFALVGSPEQDGSAAAVAKTLRSVFMWVLGILSAVLIASLSLQSFLAAASDSAAIRAAKYAISGSVPIVGSTVSGALSSLASALSYAGASIGVGAVAALVTMSAAPLILMLLYRFAMSAALGISDFVGARASSRTVSAFRSALDTLISVYAVSVLVYILEISIFMKCGVSAFG